MRMRRVVRPAVDRLDDRCLPSGLPLGLTPALLTHAYGLDSVSFSTPTGTVKGDGAGQTIALVEAYHDPTLTGDLQVFDKTFNLPTPPLDVVNLGAGPRTRRGRWRNRWTSNGRTRSRRRRRSWWSRPTRRASRACWPP